MPQEAHRVLMSPCKRLDASRPANWELTVDSIDFRSSKTVGTAVLLPPCSFDSWDPKRIERKEWWGSRNHGRVYAEGRGLNIRFLWLTWCELDGRYGVPSAVVICTVVCKGGSRVHFVAFVSNCFSSNQRTRITFIYNFYCCTVHFDICRVHSPTNALFYLKKYIKMCSKIHINIAPTCFGLRPSSGSLHWTWLKLYLC